MCAIHHDSAASDDERRRALYEGAVYVHSSRESVLGLCRVARDLIEEAFAGKDPERIHETMSVDECVGVLSDLKPKFIHHPDAKEHIRNILTDLGCSSADTYFDVPRLRTAFPGDYLKSGIAYAFHPHRDTWYSAPMCQLNWWLPVYEIGADNSMALHPRYFARAVRNGSSRYNYAEWNRLNRFSAAAHVKTDTRVQPHAEEPLDLDPDLRVLPPVGGLMIFSAAQLHSTVPNTSNRVRYSIDFRTIHVGDAAGRRGARNVDSACTGTTMGDYLRVTDLARVSAELASSYEQGSPIEGSSVPACNSA